MATCASNAPVVAVSWCGVRVDVPVANSMLCRGTKAASCPTELFSRERLVAECERIVAEQIVSAPRGVAGKEVDERGAECGSATPRDRYI